MKRIILLLMLSVLLFGCTSEDLTRKTLEKTGHTNITILGWDAFGCSNDDLTSTRFEAIMPNGELIEGTVCCGWFKRCTIRY